MVFVYNRTASDYYSIDDINRAENNLKNVTDAFRAAGYPLAAYVPHTWAENDLMFSSGINHLRAGINALYYAVNSTAWREITDGAAYTGVAEWNAWEWDLSLMNDIITSAAHYINLKRAGAVFMRAGGIF